MRSELCGRTSEFGNLYLELPYLGLQIPHHASALLREQLTDGLSDHVHHELALLREALVQHILVDGNALRLLLGGAPRRAGGGNARLGLLSLPSPSVERVGVGGSERRMCRI